MRRSSTRSKARVARSLGVAAVARFVVVGAALAAGSLGRTVGELSLDEIARQLDRPLGTVKTHLHRGLIRLRGELAPEGSA